jgi:RNA polymerase sigma-70 factor (ECF subfamily)
MNSIILKAETNLTHYPKAMAQHNMSQDVSDEDLMTQYCEGSSIAFERLYARHKGGLYRFFLRQCHSHDIAEELFQDVWMKMVNARDSYQPSAKFTTYLYRVAHNRLIDYYRHLSSSQYSQRINGDHQQTIEQTGDECSQLESLERSERGETIRRAVMALPSEQREALLMQQEGGLSLAEIAEIAGTSRETIKSRLRYAMNKLREQLGELKS